MPIEPDAKNWTWVLERRCESCGFEAALIDVTRTGSAIRTNAASWQIVLARPDAPNRPDDHTWSALEYGCHVRDVFRKFDERLGLMVETYDPLFDNWDQDATAIEDRYGEQDPAAVAAQVSEAGEALARRFDAVTPDQWHRPGRRSDGSAFTIDSFARYFLHDPVHHLWDVDGR